MKKQKKNKNELTIIEHVSELKKRILYVIFTFLIIFIICYYNIEHIFNLVKRLGDSVGYNFIYVSPQEVLIEQVKLSIITSIIIDIPFIVHHILMFVSPIFNNLKSIIIYYVYSIIFILLFLLGMLFAYYVLLPFIYKFLYDLGISSNIEAQISIKEYISLFTSIEVCIGIICELPILSVILTKIGILNPSLMVKIRPYIIVVTFIIAAIITPPDIVSQIIVAIPIIVLYQFSILVCRIIVLLKNKKRGRNYERCIKKD